LFVLCGTESAGFRQGGSDFINVFVRGIIIESTKIALFKGKKIRKTIFKNEWWFVIEDVVLALTDSNVERATTEIHRTEDSQGVPKLKEDAKVGGEIAGNAHKQLEKKLGKSIVSKKNFIQKLEKDRVLPGKKNNYGL
jgi:hypothetical protein